MATLTVSKTAGLQTSPNKLTLREGALGTASNAIIRSRHLIEPRRGFQQESNAPGGSSDRTKAFTYYGGGKVAFYTGGGSDKLAYSTGGAYTDYSSTYTPVDSATLRMKFAELNENLYVNTSTGTKVLTSLTATPAAAGVPAPFSLLPDAGADTSGLYDDSSGEWLPANSQVAYRAVLGVKDANGNVKLSAPSGRFVVTNPGSVTANLERNGGGDTVTATVSGHKYSVGDVITVSPGNGDFGTGPFTVTAVTSTTITYLETDTAGATLASQTISSGARKTSFQVWIPSGLSTSHFLQLYRTEYTSSDSVAPADEMFLVYEAFLTSSQVSNAEVQNLIDSTPEELLGDPLYTNPRTGDGIVSANALPPVGEDLCKWQERLWWANTTQQQSYDFQMLGVGSPDGVQNDDALVVGNYQYIAKNTVSNAYHFQIMGASSSPSKNIADTTRTLLSTVADLAATDGQFMESTSGDNEIPGKIRVAKTAFGASAFYVGALRPASWNPQLPQARVLSAGARAGSTVTLTTTGNHGFTTGDSVYVSVSPANQDSNYVAGLKTVTVTGATTFTYTEAGTTVALSGPTNYYVFKATETSTNNEQVHAVYYSKYQEPEAVPLLNYVYVGARNKAILRIVPLRDRLYVFKEDGIYTITGNAPNLRVDEFDLTCRLVAPDSVVAVNNSLYALTNKGVVVINEAGVGIISDDIKDTIDTSLSPAVLSVTKVQSWGAAYESENLYLLGVPTASSDTAPAVVLVYNVLERAWTKWLLSEWFAAVDPTTDKLCFSTGTSQYHRNERKAYTYADYADVEASVTLSVVSGTTLTFSISTPSTVGDVIVQGSAKSVITSVVSGTVVTVAEAVFSTGAATIMGGYHVTLEYAPQFAGAPHLHKQFSEATLHFNKANINNFTATFKTDLATSATSVTLSTSVPSFTTGANPSELVNKRLVVPLEKQMGNFCRVGINVREAYSVWQLNGYTLTFDPGTGGSTRG